MGPARSLAALTRRQLPGVYAIRNASGVFEACALGMFASTIETPDGKSIALEGLVSAPSGARGAAALAEVWSRGGVHELGTLDGYFRAVVLEDAGRRCTLVGDVFGTRPVYALASEGSLAAAPSPRCFADAGLPMTLSALGLLGTFRSMTPLLDETLVNEVRRLRPGRALVASAAEWDATWWYRFDDPEREGDLDFWSERLHEALHAGLTPVLESPELADWSVFLPITGGLDSRQLLGLLCERQRPPSRLTHIDLVPAETAAVRELARGLGQPLEVLSFANLDAARHLDTWLSCAPGMVNFHQLYLLATAGSNYDNTFAFDGLAMDNLLGQYTPAGMTGGAAPADKLFAHTYTTNGMQQKLLPDAFERLSEMRERMNAEARQLHTDEWRQTALHRIFYRALGYTGGTCGITRDGQPPMFAPGTHIEAARFFLQAPRTVTGEKRARLRLLTSRYPELSTFATTSGAAPAAMGRVRPRGSRTLQLAKQRLLHALFGAGGDPAPNTEHAWTRQVPWLRRCIDRLVHDSALVDAGVIPAELLERAWKRQLAGGMLGFTFYSFVTAELGYRALCLAQDDETLLAACGFD